MSKDTVKKKVVKNTAPAKKKVVAKKKVAVKKKVAAKRTPAKKKVAVKKRLIKKVAKRIVKRKVKKRSNDGGNGVYYDVKVTKPLLAKKPYTATCNDLIVALQMSHAEGEAFAAIWRKAAARMGNGKKDHVALYDAQKVAFYGNSLVREESK